MKRLAWVIWSAVAAVVLLVIFARVIGWFLEGIFGFRNGDGNTPEYLFWSGAGSDMAYVSVVFAALVYYRKENCKMKWCPFLGHYEFTNPETGITRKLCWIHHPDVHDKNLSPERIKHIHEAQKRLHVYLGSKPGKG